MEQRNVRNERESLLQCKGSSTKSSENTGVFGSGSYRLPPQVVKERYIEKETNNLIHVDI